MAQPNSHATVLLVGDRGLLVTGPSGAGKTTLALTLLGHCRANGVFARLVADDQVFLAVSSGRLVATAPAPIAGLAEAYGAGPAPLAFEPRAVIDMGVELVPAATAPRLSDGSREVLPGLCLPWLELAERNAAGAALAVLSRLAMAPFG